MKWFRRSTPRAQGPRARSQRAGSHRPVSARTPHDWRSFDYDDAAAGYARVVAPMTREPARDLLAMVPLEPGARVLDVGCGTADAVASLDAFAVGVDAATTMVAQARAAHPDARIAAADTIDLPFREAAFDAVSAIFVLPYVTKLDTALHELKRALKPGGTLAVAGWTDVLDDLNRTWRGLAREVLGVELLRDALSQGSPWAEVVADPKRLEGALRDNGFTHVHIERRQYRNELARDDYVVGREVEVIGRYIHKMLGKARWPAFRERARATFAERFPERVVDLRDVLFATARKR